MTTLKFQIKNFKKNVTDASLIQTKNSKGYR